MVVVNLVVAAEVGFLASAFVYELLVEGGFQRPGGLSIVGAYFIGLFVFLGLQSRVRRDGAREPKRNTSSEARSAFSRANIRLVAERTAEVSGIAAAVSMGATLLPKWLTDRATDRMDNIFNYATDRTSLLFDLLREYQEVVVLSLFATFVTGLTIAFWGDTKS